MFVSVVSAGMTVFLQLCEQKVGKKLVYQKESKKKMQQHKNKGHNFI